MPESPNPRPVALGPFYREAELILSHTPHEVLIDRLLSRARELPSAERAKFLALIEPEDQWGHQDSSLFFEGVGELMSDIEAFVTDVRAGKFVVQTAVRGRRGAAHGGNTSWVGRVDELLARANDEFLVGDRGLAAAAFKHIFNVFRLDDGTTLAGDRRASEMVSSDLQECKARYLRSVYETAVPHQRAIRLLEAMRLVSSFGQPELGIEAVNDADIEELDDLRGFLNSWLGTLRAADPSRSDPRKDPQWRRVHLFLLKEAVVLVSGSDGLRQLAEEKGDRHPHFYISWVTSLVEETRYKEALDASGIALASVQDLEARARIADQRAELAQICGLPVDAVHARRMAWQCRPTAARLVHFLHESPSEGLGPDERAAEMLRNHLHDETLPSSLAGILELLAGRYNVAVRRVSAAPVLGWSRPEHPSPVLLPFMLYAATGVTGFDADSRMWLLWKQMIERITEQVNPEIDFGDMLMRTLKRHPVRHDMAELFLAVAGESVTQRARAIVTRQHRRAYRRVAETLVATVESILLSGDRRRGELFIGEFRREFPGHRAFQFELQEQLEASPYGQYLLR